MSDYDLFDPSIKYDPRNYEVAPAAAFGVDLMPPSAPTPPPTLDQQYAAAFPGSATVGMPPAAPPPVMPAPGPMATPTAPAPATLDDAAQIMAMSRSGGRAGVDTRPQRAAIATQRAALAAGAAEEQAAANDTIAASGDAVAAVLGEKQIALENYAAEAAARAAEQAEGVRTRRAEYEERAREASEAQAKIDPNRLMKGGGGILFGIASALGALGSSLLKSPNFVQQSIEAALDRDLHAQELNARGAKEKASFARDVYEGFVAGGHDEVAAKQATFGVMLQAFAARTEAMSQNARTTEGKARGAEIVSQLQDGALQHMDQAAQLRARQATGGGSSAAELIKTQGALLDNQKKAVELAGGGTAPKQPVTARTAKDIQDDLDAIKDAGLIVTQLETLRADGSDTLPDRGGVTNIGRTIRKGVKSALVGGEGYTPTEARVMSALGLGGSQIFRMKTGQSANTVPERAEGDRVLKADGSVEGSLGAVRDAQKTAIERAAKSIALLPPGRERDELTKQLAERSAAVSLDTDAYRKQFGSK
jgi:hypothetical protein